MLLQPRWHQLSFFPPDADQREKKYKAHRQFGDRRGGVISARTYFYADEAKCDAQMETFKNCIKASGEGSCVRVFAALMLQQTAFFHLAFRGGLNRWIFGHQDDGPRATAVPRKFAIVPFLMQISHSRHTWLTRLPPLMNSRVCTAPVFRSPGEVVPLF